MRRAVSAGGPGRAIALGIAAGSALLLALGCASGQACQRDPITGSERCQAASGDYGEAAVTTAAAATAWAVAGCTVNDCEPPLRCNDKTKQCERIRCDEGGRGCPPGYFCDPDDHLCK